MALPESWSIGQVADFFGVSRNTAKSWRRRHDDFPEPKGYALATPLYDPPTVIAWWGQRRQEDPSFGGRRPSA